MDHRGDNPTGLFGPDWPLDVDQLCEWLYEVASESGDADPVQIRELADSVWHFLSEEFVGHSPNLVELQESAVKLTRELGQPQLAELLQATLPDESHPNAWPSNLTAAHRLGIITIAGFETPAKLVGGCLEFESFADFKPDTWYLSLQKAAQHFSDFFIINDYQLTQDQPSSEDARSRLREAIGRTVLQVVFNLNCQRSEDGIIGLSLFPEQEPPRVSCPLDYLDTQYWSPTELDRTIWRWHLRKEDLADRQKMIRICDVAFEMTNWQFVLCRPGDEPNQHTVFHKVTIQLLAFAEYCKSRLEQGRLKPNVLPSLVKLVFESVHVRQRIVREAGGHPPRNSAMVIELRGDAKFTDDLVRTIHREAEYDTTGMNVHVIRDQAPMIDLRTGTGPRGYLDDLNAQVSRISIVADATHHLTTERIIHVLAELFHKTRVREVHVEVK